MPIFIQRVGKTNIINNYGRHLPIILAGLGVLTVLSYLLVVNNTNTMGIEIAEMQLKINKLKDQNTDLSNSVAQLKSISRIESISKNELAMVASETYQYLDAVKPSLAIRP